MARSYSNLMTAVSVMVRVPKAAGTGKKVVNGTDTVAVTGDPGRQGAAHVTDRLAPAVRLIPARIESISVWAGPGSNVLPVPSAGVRTPMRAPSLAAELTRLAVSQARDASTIPNIIRRSSGSAKSSSTVDEPRSNPGLR